jgi:hypothetical protein
LSAGIFLQQFLRAGERDIGVLQLSLGLSNRCLFNFDVGFEGSPLKSEEKVALLDLRTLDKRNLIQECGDARNQVDMCGA